jgi:hypothetical protein
MTLPTIPHDKALHFIYGAIIFCVLFVLATLVIPHYEMYVAAGAVVFFAVGKELLDVASNYLAKKKGLVPTHGVEVMDAVATCVGGVVVAIPLCPKYLV